MDQLAVMRVMVAPEDPPDPLAARTRWAESIQRRIEGEHRALGILWGLPLDLPIVNINTWPNYLQVEVPAGALDPVLLRLTRHFEQDPSRDGSFWLGHCMLVKVREVQ